jgi:hypothetical protein
VKATGGRAASGDSGARHGAARHALRGPVDSGVDEGGGLPVPGEDRPGAYGAPVRDPGGPGAYGAPVRGQDPGWSGAGRQAAGAPPGQPVRKPLWVEEPTRRRRMPDPVRTAVVRAVLVIAVTLFQGTVAFFATVTRSWLALPVTVSGVACTVLATWAVQDVLVTRQAWKQRHGVVSQPSSTARAARFGRRRARRQARAAARARGHSGRGGGTGWLSQP